MNLMEKYNRDMTIRHDKEVISQFCDDFILSIRNKGTFKYSVAEKDGFIDSWLERYYFKNDNEKM